MLIAVLLFTVIVVEFFDNNIIYYIVTYVDLFLIATFYIYLFLRYKKYHKSVEEKKREKLEELRPESELRTYGFMEEEVRKIPKFPEYKVNNKKRKSTNKWW